MMTKTYRSILAMLALTVSVAGASYGQDGSLDFVLKDVVVGKYPWLFSSSFSMLLARKQSTIHDGWARI